MYLFVVALRTRNERLSRLAVLAQSPAYGRLWLRPANQERYDRRAKLADLLAPDGKEALQPLVNAMVAKIDMGVHVTGFEYRGRGGAKSQVSRYQQSWLCAPTVEELRRLINLIPAQVDNCGNLIDDDDLPF